MSPPLHNERQKLFFGSQSSQIPPANGTFSIDSSYASTATLNFNDSSSTIQSALEGLVGIGSGNISVSDILDNGFIIDDGGAGSGSFTAILRFGNRGDANLALGPLDNNVMKTALDSLGDIIYNYQRISSTAFLLLIHNYFASDCVIFGDTTDGTGATVSVARVGLQFDFQGSLSNTNVHELEVSSSLTQVANRFTITNTQSGTAPFSINPNIGTSIYATTPVAGTNGTLRLYKNDDTSGTLVVYRGDGFSATIDIGSWSASYIQSQLSAGFPDCGPFVATDLGGGAIGVDIGYGDKDILLYSSVSYDNSGTDIQTSSCVAGPTPPTSPVDGIFQQDSLSFSDIANYGTYDLVDGNGNRHTFAYNASASDIQTWLRVFLPSGITVSGDYTTSFTIVYNDGGFYNSYTLTADNFNNASGDLKNAGRPQIFTLSKDDNPTEGQFRVFADSSWDDWISATQTNLTTIGQAIGISDWTVTGSGTSGDPWICTRNSNQADQTIIAEEDESAPLRKALSAEMITTHEGGTSVVLIRKSNLSLLCL